MTRFEKDYNEIKYGNDLEATVILRERKTELDELKSKCRAEKNGFRWRILAEQYLELNKEYEALQELL